MTSSPTILELPNCGAWQVMAEPDLKRHLGQGFAWGPIQLVQVVRERPEPAGLSHYPWASTALGSYLLPGLFTGCVTITCTFPPAGPEHLGAGPILSYSSASQTAGLKRH